MPHATSIDRALNACVNDALALLVREKELSVQTLVRLEALMRQFARFLEVGLGVDDVADVTATAVSHWVMAPTADGREAGNSIQHFRRLAVRTMYRALRAEGAEVGDPTIDLTLPSRQRGDFRPLDDDEVGLCRAACLGCARRNRAAAAWALGEATARTGELPSIRRGDIDLYRARVWISGTDRTAARWGQLSEWGSTQLANYLSTSAGSDDELVLYSGDPAGALAQSSAVGAISRTLTRAGLGEAPDVRPSSLPAWAGQKIFMETGRIDETARKLGMRSLDRTAAFIGWEWATPGD